MSEVLYYVVTAVLMVLMLNSGVALLGPDTLRRDTIRRHRVPWVAIALTTLVTAGLVLQSTWPGAMDALDNDPARTGWWRVVTSLFLQNGGPVGDAFNLVTIAVVTAFAEWYWAKGYRGSVLTLVLFVCGAVLPSHISELFVTASTVSTDPRNYVGSSGATFFLAATFTAALLPAAHDRRERLLSLAVPVIGLATFALQANAHGLVTLYGWVLGLLVALVLRRYRRPVSRTGPGAARRPADR